MGAQNDLLAMALVSLGWRFEVRAYGTSIFIVGSRRGRVLLFFSFGSMGISSRGVVQSCVFSFVSLDRPVLCDVI